MEKPSVYVCSLEDEKRDITGNLRITLWGCVAIERARIQNEQDTMSLMDEAARQVFRSDVNFIDVTVTAVNLVS